MRIRSIIVILLLYCGLTQAQQYNFIKYNVQEGLPNAQLSQIYQDSKAYLWIATQGGGLSRFDGANFDIYNTKEGLPTNTIHHVFEDQSSQLWLGTPKGLVALNDKGTASVYMEERQIHSISQQNKNTLWVGTDKGLYTFDVKTKKAEKQRMSPRLNIAKVNALLHVGKDLWVASSKGLFVLKGGKAITFDGDTGLKDTEVKSLAVDKNDRVWAAVLGRGVINIASRSKSVLVRYVDNEFKNAQEIFIDSESRLWVGTKDIGVLFLDQDQLNWKRISVAEGLSNNNVQSVLEDSWGNIWFGTVGGGVNKFLGQYFSHYNSDTGLNGNRIYAVTEDSKGTLWLSVDDKGVSTIDSMGIRTDIDGDYINTKCNHIMEDEDGRMWFSTAGGGLVMKDNEEYWVFNELDGLPSNWITATVQDTAGSIWVGTYANGLSKVAFADSVGIRVTTYDVAAGLPDPFITVMRKDRRGKVWFGTKQGGLGYIAQDTIFTLSNQNFPKAEISAIAFDENDHVWVAVVGYGLYLSQSANKEAQFKRVTISQSLTSRNINQLIFDQEGHLWVGSELGLDKIIFKQGELEGVQHFGRNEGFLGVETSRNAVTQDLNGHLWFGTRNGLSKHKPGNTQLKIAPPKIHFTGLSLMYRPLRETEYAHYLVKGDSLGRRSVFKHNQNNLGFGFRGINIDYPKEISYTWKLDGFDKQWSPASSAKTVNFTNLPPGKYRFLTKAINAAGLESDVISSSFEISPALWQSLWFQLAVVLGVALLAYLIFRNRINKVRKREAARRAQLELENELLGLEQKALQLQMNPHFIFNALNSIQSVVVTQKTDIARDQIQNFAGLMRGVLNSSKKQSITLQEEHDTIDKYLKLEQFCQTTDFDFAITLPNEYDPEEIEISPMMIQPFVENAVIHGISHLKHQGRITVNFEIENDLLSCTISDNGVGREKAATLRKNNSGHQSVAIEVTRKRLESLRGQQKYTAFSVADVLDAQRAVNGTVVKLKMPLKLTF